MPTPVPFAVENVTFNNTPLGDFWCLGEIHNTTGLDLEQAGVKIVLVNEQGETVAEAQGTCRSSCCGQAATPFAVRFTNPPQSFASYLAIPGRASRATSATITWT